MSTLRKEIIRLAHSNPELRAHLLPILKEAGKGKPVGSDKIRSGFYQVTDGLNGLSEAIQKDAATKDDDKLEKALKELDQAVGKVQAALKPYAWD